MDILKELFGTSDELQISKSLFGSDAPSTSVELGLDHPFSIPSRDNLPRPLPLLPEPRPSHSLARSHSLDDLQSASGGGGSGAEENEGLGYSRPDSLRAQSVFPHLTSNAPSSHVYLHNVPHEMPMYLLEEDEGNDEEIMRLLETTTDSLSTPSSTRSGGDGRTASSPVFQDERVSLPGVTQTAGDNSTLATGKTHEQCEGKGHPHPREGRSLSDEVAGEGAKVTATNPPLLEVAVSEGNAVSLTLPVTSREPFPLHPPSLSQESSITPSPGVSISVASPPRDTATPNCTESIPATCSITSISTVTTEPQPSSLPLPSSLLPPPPPPPPPPPLPPWIISLPTQTHGITVSSSEVPQPSVALDTIAASILPMRDEGTQTLHNTSLRHGRAATISEGISLPLSSSASPLTNSVPGQPHLLPAQLLPTPLSTGSIAVSRTDTSPRQQREARWTSVTMPTSSNMQRIHTPPAQSSCHLASAVPSSAAVISVPSPTHLPIPTAPSINLAPTFLPVAVSTPRALLSLSLPASVQQSIEKLKEQVMIQGQRLEEALKTILPVPETSPGSGTLPLSPDSSAAMADSHGCSPTDAISSPSVPCVSSSSQIGALTDVNNAGSDQQDQSVTHTPLSGVTSMSAVTPVLQSPAEANLTASPHEVSPVAMCSVATQVSSPTSEEEAGEKATPPPATPVRETSSRAEAGLNSREGEVRVQGSDLSFSATPDEGTRPQEVGERTSATDTSCSALSASPMQQLAPESLASSPTQPSQPATASPHSPSVSIATTSPDHTHKVTATADLNPTTDVDRHTPSPEIEPVKAVVKEIVGQPDPTPTPSQEGASSEVCVEHEEDMEVEGGGRVGSEGSPTSPQQPIHWNSEGVAPGNEERDHSPCNHGDEMQHDLPEGDITRSPNQSEWSRPPVTVAGHQPEAMTTSTSDSSNRSSTIATSSAASLPAVTTSSGPTPSVGATLLPGLSLPPSFSVCLPSMSWRAQSFAKVFGLNALPIKLLPSKGGQGAGSGGGSDGRQEGGQKEGRTKRKRNGGGWPKGKKRKIKPKATPPKPPATAYGLFLSEQRQAVSERHTFKSMAQLSRKIGRMWGETTDEQKQVYYERASQDRQRYLEELKTYICDIHKENSAESLERVNSVLTQCLENEENNDLLVCHVCQTSFITLHNKRSHYLGKMHTDKLWEELTKLLGDAAKTKSTKSADSSSESALRRRKRKNVHCHGDGDQDDPNSDELGPPGSDDGQQDGARQEAESPSKDHTSKQSTRTIAEGGVSGNSAISARDGSPPPRGVSEEAPSDCMLTGGQGSEEVSEEVEVSMADSPGGGRGEMRDLAGDGVEVEDVPDDNVAQDDNVQGSPVSTGSTQQGDLQTVPSDDTRTDPLSVPTATNQSCDSVISCDTPTGVGCHGDSQASDAPQSLQQWAQNYTGFLVQMEEKMASFHSGLEHCSTLQAVDEVKESGLVSLLDELRSEEKALTDHINKLLHCLQRIASS